MFIGNYKTPIKNLYKGIEDGSWKKISSALPEDVVDTIEDNIIGLQYFSGMNDMDDYIGTISDEIKYQYGDNFKIKIKYKDKDKLDKDEIESLENYYNYSFDKKIHIKKAYNVECELTIKGKEDKDKTETNIIVGKIGSKWYIINADDFDNFF